MNVMPEEWGGDVPIVEVSAREKLGLDDLLEVILLVADVHELKANPHKPASRRRDRGQGRSQPRSGCDRSHPKWNAQPARRRCGGRDLGPNQGDVRRSRASAFAGRSRALRSKSLVCLKCRRLATRCKCSKTSGARVQLAEERQVDSGELESLVTERL